MVADTVPRVRWLRFYLASAISQSAPPHVILDNYNDWLAWRDGARKVRACGSCISPRALCRPCVLLQPTVEQAALARASLR